MCQRPSRESRLSVAADVSLSRVLAELRELQQKHLELQSDAAALLQRVHRAKVARELAWLHKVVRNGCMDMIKTEGRRRTRERASAAPEATQERVPEVEMEDTQGTVRAAIAALPVEQREVLSLRLFEEKSYRDIAEVTGKKVGTIGWLVSEGLKALALRLGPALGEVGGSSTNIGTTSGGA